ESALRQFRLFGLLAQQFREALDFALIEILAFGLDCKDEGRQAARAEDVFHFQQALDSGKRSGGIYQSQAPGELAAAVRFVLSQVGFAGRWRGQGLLPSKNFGEEFAETALHAGVYSDACIGPKPKGASDAGTEKDVRIGVFLPKTKTAIASLEAVEIGH